MTSCWEGGREEASEKGREGEEGCGDRTSGEKSACLLASASHTSPPLLLRVHALSPSLSFAPLSTSLPLPTSPSLSSHVRAPPTRLLRLAHPSQPCCPLLLSLSLRIL
eukprot:483926-Rhodomonas_salina.1